MARKSALPILLMTVLLTLPGCFKEQNGDGTSKPSRDASSVDILEAACALGEDLARLQYSLQIGASESEMGVRVLDVLRRAIEESERRLGVEVPPKELGDSYDPRATELAEELSRTQGPQASGCFAFGYHATHASQAAGRLSRLMAMSSESWEEGFLDLALTVHADLAVDAAEALGPEAGALEQGRAIREDVHRLKGATRPRQAAALQTLHHRIDAWQSKVKVDLLFEARLGS